MIADNKVLPHGVTPSGCQDKAINEAAGFYDLKPCASGEGRRILRYKGKEYTLCPKHFTEFLAYTQRGGRS